MKRLFSGVKPTGTLHLGNYFGAMRQFVSLAEQYDSMFMVADYHSINAKRDPQELRENIYDIARAYLAIGLNPETTTIFQQSQVSEHTEATWVFNNLVPVSLLMQAHAYKDALANGKEANMGLFDYPILMAADILLYDTEVVPVGKDQKQHIEYAREVAAKFNNTYGEMFIEPQEHILDDVAVVPGVDGRKMSKSYDNTIPLFGNREALQRTVMSIVTDSTGERPEHVYNIHKLVRSEETLASLYEEHRGKYKTLKEALIEDLDTFVSPLRERYEAIDNAQVAEVLARGSARARERAAAKMQEVRNRIGVQL